MATIKFKDYNRLERAVDQAECELAAAYQKKIERTREIRHATERLEQIESLKDLYDFSRNGAIYIDLDEVNLIKRFSILE